MDKRGFAIVPSMVRTANAKGGFKPVAFAAMCALVALPSAGLAVTILPDAENGLTGDGFTPFTPAEIDPLLASRVAANFVSQGIRFTPANRTAPDAQEKRTVTVAVRLPDEAARAITVRGAIDRAEAAAPGIERREVVAIAPSRYDLGIARGYQSFAKPVTLPKSVSRVAMPDLAEFKPGRGAAKDEPSRFQTRIALENDTPAGRSPRTVDSFGEQSVDVAGSYSLTRNLDVTAGVRIAQDRDRLAPLADGVEDSQAVYVGTQFRF